MKFSQSILILSQVLMYMGSIATTIYLYNFYSLFSSLLSYYLALLLYSYNENNDTLQYNTYEGDFSSFPSYNVKLSNRLKSYIYFTFITLIVYNREMRSILKIYVTIPKTFNITYVSPDISLMFHPFEIQNVCWCVSSCPLLCFLAMILHHPSSS
jgi:hypothetical protein